MKEGGRFGYAFCVGGAKALFGYPFRRDGQ
jgi:hypothetical protein